jgi:uncharacterized protein YqgC (DUF456 family)
MDGFLNGAATFGVWAGVIAWTLALVAACLVVLLSLPGGWIALGLAVVWDAFHAFHSIGFVRLGTFVALLLVGEAVEAALGSLYVARKGASRWGIAGTFVGGIVGAILGSGLMPVVGTLVGAFAGAFAGAVGAEYLRDRRLEPSLRVGFHATVGRFLALSVKGLLATGGAVLAAWPVWAALLGRSAT